jgi:hypothetical protein
MGTYDELLEEAGQIKTNESPESNTHILIGDQFINIIEKLKSVDKQCQDKLDLKFDKATIQVLSEDRYEALKEKKKDVFYFTYEEEL